MKLLLNAKNVIIDMAQEIVEQEQGYLCNNCIYPFTVDDFRVEEVAEIPAEVKIGKYLYENGTFKLNPNYVEPINSETEIKNLKEQIATLQSTVLELLGV